MIKSPLRYPGGKSKALSQILPLVPPFEEFREPFVGGGSVFLSLRQQFPDKKFWINDLYFELYMFWEYAQKNTSSLVDQVQAWKDQYKEGKTLYRFLLDNRDDFEDLNIASAFFVFNRITFSGTTEAGGYSEQAFQKRFTQSSIERLGKLDGVLDDIKITCEDYESMILEEGKDVFIFLDPPYYSTSKSALYGKSGKLHKGFDHERLAENMKKCKHKWLITLDNSDYIKELYDFAIIQEWNLTYGMRNQTENSSQKGTELFISNF